MAKYDPTYDPLVSRSPGVGQEFPPSYWAASAGTPPPDDGPVTADMEADVVIIGAGYTGLCTAIFLAREHGIRAVVLEANRTGFGCSGRNGGQAQNNTGRLKRSQWIQRWGMETAQAMHLEVLDGFRTFESLLRDYNIECDAQPGGHFLIAHKPAMLAGMEAEVRVMEKHFDYHSTMIDAQTLRSKYVADAESAGAMHEPDGIGVHPMKLAFGYQRVARELGARIHTASPVIGWETRDGFHYLKTPGGTVRARSVGIATGGYTAPDLHPTVKFRYMPILSNNSVTRVLTDAEIAACNFQTREVLTDTRMLRYYYRLLPGNRLQFGSRSAITGADAPRAVHQKLLEDGIARKFPVLAGIPLEYSWWGWVDVSHDMMPRIHQPDPRQQVFYAFGYGGNGVSYSAQAGRRMAEQIAGRAAHQKLPIFTSQLPTHPFRPFRRLGQRMLYHWWAYRDEQR